jgi:hypothetical protein
MTPFVNETGFERNTSESSRLSRLDELCTPHTAHHATTMMAAVVVFQASCDDGIHVVILK